ncbi:MAG: LysM peptidoglycan-binding domain-containing protein [Verrucomicrobiaceae bacterium]|nr:MAG: LysM peptidoglycan-binding domain-containing protein [Verrucomicrobiaceae bacterium]
MIIRTLVILALVAAILGGSGYFAYESFVKPKKLDIQEQKLAETAPPPPPDPSLAAFESLKPSLDQDTPEAQTALQHFLDTYPESPMSSAVRAAIGRINSSRLLSPDPSPEKAPYTVVSGDSLVKIAAKFKSGAELIYRANRLATINLKIGQQLMIPKLDTALVVDRAANSVTLLNAGAFVREYPIKSLKLPPAAGKGSIETKVADKVAMKGSVRAAFGTKDYDGSDRWLMLGAAGIVVRGTPAAAADGTTPPMPPGIVLDPADAEEIFVLTTRGTPVTIK